MNSLEFLCHFEANSRLAVSKDGECVPKQGLDAMWGLEENEGMRFHGFRL